MTIGSDTGYIL